jgi:hypothetical protein
MEFEENRRKQRKEICEMGKINDTLGSFLVGSERYEIQRDLSADRKIDHGVHIRSDGFRMEMAEDELLLFASAVMLAERNLRSCKDL